MASVSRNPPGSVEKINETGYSSMWLKGDSVMTNAFRAAERR